MSSARLYLGALARPTGGRAGRCPAQLKPPVRCSTEAACLPATMSSLLPNVVLKMKPTHSR
eukprot:3104082-Pleurochrysis_carterae.AAC.1